MAKRRKKSGGAKRTISPEQQAKMQAARKAASVHKRRVKQLYKSGIAMEEEMSHYDREINKVRRKPR